MIFAALLCVIFLYTFGFFTGAWAYNWSRVRRQKMAEKMIMGNLEKGAQHVPKCRKAVAVAAQCWCDPRTSFVEMDTRLAEVFAERIAEYIDALQWCSGAADFQRGGDGVPAGCAVEGFDRVCRVLMTDDYDISHLSVDEYRNLRDNYPEILGLKEG